MENVINCGYDPTEFAEFMEYKMGKSNNITINESSIYSRESLFNLNAICFRGRHKCGQLGV